MIQKIAFGFCHKHSYFSGTIYCTSDSSYLFNAKKNQRKTASHIMQRKSKKKTSYIMQKKSEKVEETYGIHNKMSN